MDASKKKMLIKAGIMIVTVGFTATAVYFGFQYMRKRALLKQQNDNGAGGSSGDATARGTGTGTGDQSGDQRNTHPLGAQNTNEGPKVGGTRAGAGKTTMIGQQRGGAN